MNGALTVDGASTLTGALSIGGNVGIGVAVPNSYYAKNLVVGAVADNGGITIASSATNIAAGLYFADGTSGADAYRGQIVYDHDDNSMGFWTNAAGPRLHIDTNGKVGIGTTSPIAQLTLQKDYATDITLTEAPRMAFYNDQDTELVATDVLGSISWGAREKSSSGTDRKGAYIRCAAGAAWTTDVDRNPTDMTFHVQDDSDTANIDTQAMTIRYDGNVGIGTSAPAENLHISGAGEIGMLVTSTDNDSVLELASDTDQGQNSKLIFSSGSSPSKATILYDHHDTPASAKMQFLVGDNAVTAATILGNGNIGIGTTTPNALLHLFGASPTLQLSDDSADGGGGAFNIDFCNQNTVQARIHSNLGNESISFYTNASLSTAQMTIDNQYGGSVGIGTTSPDATLHIRGASSSGHWLNLTTTDTAIIDGDILGAIYFGADDDSHSPFTYGALIRAEGAEVWDTDHVNHNPTELQFFTSDDSSTAIAQRMVIDKDGKVGIGTVAPSYKVEIAGTPGSAVQLFHASNYDGSTSSAGAVRIVSDASNNSDFQMFDSAGSVHIRMHGNASGNDYIGNASGHSLFILGSYDDGLAGTRLPAYIKSDGQVLVDTSSIKYKTNVEDITDVSWLYDLKPRKFEFKEAYQDPATNRQMRKETGDGIPHYGFIAEEVNELDTVTVVRKDGEIEALQYTEFIPVLVKAVQELSAKVTALENA